MKKPLILAVLTAALAIPASASAAKPVPTLVFTTNPIPAYNIYTVTGCGYPRSAALTVELENSASVYSDLYFAALSDSSGCLARLVDVPGVIWFQAGDAGSTDEITIWHNSKMLAQGVETVVFNG